MTAGVEDSAVLHDHAGHRLDGLADFRRQAEALAEVELHLLAVLEGNHQADLAAPPALARQQALRSEEHTSELQSLMRISYAVFCLKKKRTRHMHTHHNISQHAYRLHH